MGESPDYQPLVARNIGESPDYRPDQPPIWDIDFAGLMNPGLLIRCPSSLRQIAVSMTEPRCSSDTPERIRSRSGVSCRENRHVRRPPSAVRRTRLHVVQNAWLTEEMQPIPPAA